MPIYVYSCKNKSCKNHDGFEVIQSIKEEALKKCKLCNSNLKRLISKTSFTFKGGAPTPKHYG